MTNSEVDRVTEAISAAESSDGCDTCDRPRGHGIGKCDRYHRAVEYNATVAGTDGWGTEGTNAAYKRMSDSERECRARRVDWVRRARAAESRLAEVEARTGTVEQIAAWLIAKSMPWTDGGLVQTLVRSLAAEIIAGAWRKK